MPEDTDTEPEPDQQQIVLNCQQCGSITIADNNSDDDENFTCFDCRKLRKLINRFRNTF